MSLRDFACHKERLRNNPVAAQYQRLKGSSATRGLGAVVMLVMLVFVAGCGLPAQVRHRTTTTPFATPAGEHQLTLYAGTRGGWVYAMSAADGHERWRIRDRVWALLADGVLYAAGGQRLDARFPTDGTVRWHAQLFDQPNRAIAAAPVIDHGVIYVAMVCASGR